MRDFKRFVEILIPTIKPIEQWDDEDRKVCKLTILAIVIFLLGSMI